MFEVSFIPMYFPPFHLRMETNPVSEILCSLEWQIMDKVHELSNSTDVSVSLNVTL